MEIQNVLDGRKFASENYVVLKIHLFYQCDYASITYGRLIVVFNGYEEEHDAFSEGKSNHRTRVTQVQ